MRAFGTTHWTVIEAIRSADNAQRRALTGELLKSYWKPVYCYLRRKGFHNEQAKDLTQGFFQEIVLGRDLVQSADPAKGRFRTLLLTALERYLASDHRRQTAQKAPAQRMAGSAWTGPRWRSCPIAVQSLSCEDTFHYAWVTELLDRTA